MASAFCRARRGSGERQRLSHAFSGVGSGVESLSDYIPPMPRGRQGRGGGAGTEEGTLITWIIIDFPSEYSKQINNNICLFPIVVRFQCKIDMQQKSLSPHWYASNSLHASIRIRSGHRIFQYNLGHNTFIA